MTQPETLSYTRSELTNEALKYNEGTLNHEQVLCVVTGSRTGRSPNDRYIIDRTEISEKVAWGKINRPYPKTEFTLLWDLAAEHLQKRSYHSILYAGANPSSQVRLSVRTEFAWHQIFAMNLFIEKTDDDKAADTWQILNAPTLAIPEKFNTHSSAAVMIDLVARKILIIGMRYAGEMKKAVFSALNFWLPEKNILPMHCAANQDSHGNVALFFGLSGTGKTTLSSDPERTFIGDDEHGWSEDGIFNIEGGCYAKCINLSEKKEPVIWQAMRPGAVMENVYLNHENRPDFANISLTENARMGYPLSFIPRRVVAAQGSTPKHVIFLTCDLYGVLPPVSVLSQQQAAFYFLMGYTAKLGSTEVGSTANISPAFSACFGAPFFPRRAKEYAQLLNRRITDSGAKVFLVNTGWHRGPYGSGIRYDIDYTRSIVRAICENKIDYNTLRNLPGFNLAFPSIIEGIQSNLLDPRATWSNQEHYQEQANQLIEQFIAHSKNTDIPETILASCPQTLSESTSLA